MLSKNKNLTAPIVEIFESIQGEGKNIGKPVIFIRFFGCNLRCKFNGENCDTPYSVNKKSKSINEYSLVDILKKIKESKLKHIVFTGGEPLLHQNFIINLLNKLDYYSEIETNSTLIPKKKLIELINLFTLSPKLKNSNQEKNYEKLRLNKSAIKSFPKNKSIFKFVVNSSKDITEIKNIRKINPLETFLMPLGTTKKEIINVSKKVVALCIKYNFNFSPREHIIIWNGKKGK